MEPHVYHSWVGEEDVGMTCCLEPRYAPIHIDQGIDAVEIAALAHVGTLEVGIRDTITTSLWYEVPSMIAWCAERMQQHLIDGFGVSVQNIEWRLTPMYMSPHGGFVQWHPVPVRKIQPWDPEKYDRDRQRRR
jgi:hypothetical protein